MDFDPQLSCTPQFVKYSPRNLMYVYEWQLTGKDPRAVGEGLVKHAHAETESAMYEKSNYTAPHTYHMNRTRHMNR